MGALATDSLALCMAWAIYGEFCLKAYWPLPSSVQHTGGEETYPWAKHSHLASLTPAGQHRQPPLTRWARATFEQAALSLLPQLEGTVQALVLPGTKMFQENRIDNTYICPAILHSYGLAKHAAPRALAFQATLGWETFPVCLRGLKGDGQRIPAAQHQLQACCGKVPLAEVASL